MAAHYFACYWPTSRRSHASTVVDLQDQNVNVSGLQERVVVV